MKMDSNGTNDNSQGLLDCGSEWECPGPNETSTMGTTNYTPCYSPEIEGLITEIDAGKYETFEEKIQILEYTRTLGVGCNMISFLSLLFAILIFKYCGRLKNAQTRIHTQMFLAIQLQVLIHIVLDLEQLWKKENLDEVRMTNKAAAVILEYSITAMYMWTLVEGLYLRKITCINATFEQVPHVLYSWIGWGLPAIHILLWASVTVVIYHNGTANTCWYGEHFSVKYWTLQGPRMFVLLVNFFMQLLILKILIMKIARNRLSLMEKVKRVFRSALWMIPLLGFINIANIFPAPLSSGIGAFGSWCVITYFLRSAQGLIMAALYCFVTDEVRLVIKKAIRDYVIQSRVGRNSFRRGKSAHYDEELQRTRYKDAENIVDEHEMFEI